jgi:pimeloyl-ACP methyl ester carboxylesterase
MVAQQRVKIRVRNYLVAILVVLGGCAQFDKPDLERLYRYQQGNPDQPPIILIPGILGSRLSFPDGKAVWPGSAFKILVSDFAELELKVNPDTLEPEESDLVVTGLTDAIAGQDFYGRLRDVLERAGGFVESVPGTPAKPGERRYYVLAYDWRQDNLAAVRKLDALIKAIRRDYQNPDLEVDVVAHSMGGTITRYFIRYGPSDELTDNEFPINNYGASRIRRAILLGTPSLGTISALKAIIGGQKVGFGRLSAQLVASWPSSYQMLPHPIYRSLISVDGKALDSDLFDVETWRSFQFSIFDPKVEKEIVTQYENPSDGEEYLRLLQSYFAKHLERARRFVWSLTVKAPQPDVKMIVFGGDCRPTPARLVVEEVNGRAALRTSPREIENPNKAVNYDHLMMEPGDGTVTKASLLARRTHDPTVQRHEWSFFDIEYAFFLCVEHTRLTSNINFQDNLLHAILSVDEETPQVGAEQ